jgi:hypothetical protein
MRVGTDIVAFHHEHTGGKFLSQKSNVFIPSVNINASYIEALLRKELIRCKIYFLLTFFLNWPSYIDVFQKICFSYFLDGFSQICLTLIIIDKDEINLFCILIFLST